jgi:hypothetical protein
MRNADRPSGHNELERSAGTRRLCELIVLLAGVCFCFSPAVWAQTPDSQTGSSEKSWTASTESKTDNANPTRTIQSHTQNGNRAVDVRSLQARGPDGNFQPYQDIETETVQENSTTVRTTTRTFVRDSSGAKTLFQITEENKQTSPAGDSKVVRTTSNPDANGNLQVVQRENRVTTRISPDVEDTKTTVMLPGVNGLAPAMQILERQNVAAIPWKFKRQPNSRMAPETGKWVKYGTPRSRTKARPAAAMSACRARIWTVTWMKLPAVSARNRKTAPEPGKSLRILIPSTSREWSATAACIWCSASRPLSTPVPMANKPPHWRRNLIPAIPAPVCE